MEAGTPAVLLRKVSKSFGGHAIVRSVSLEVGQGEFFSLLGASGCGKTTTLRGIAGFERFDSGELYILGKESSNTPVNKRDVNVVFQNYALFPHLTVARNIAFGLEIQRLASNDIKRKVGEVLELIQLQGLADRFPKQLSGGQQQRVAIARAIVTEPSVLLLDEPLGALDFRLRQEMQLELKKLQRQLRTTFIYVTHDQEEALSMSDRIAVMRDGSVLQVGTPAEIYEAPQSEYVASFIGECNLLPGTLLASSAGTSADVLGTQLPVDGASLLLGSDVFVCLRPEHMRLAPPGESPPGWDAVVTDILYGGKDFRVKLRLGSGDLCLARVPPSGLPSLQDKVRVTWTRALPRCVPRAR